MANEPQSDLCRRLWFLYNSYRDAAMNRKYYGIRLGRTRRLAMALDVLVAVGTSSSVGGWVIWKDSAGAATWAVLSGIAAVIAVVKPLLKLTDKVERYSKLFVGHGEALYDLKAAVGAVAAAGDYPESLSRKVDGTIERFKRLAEHDDPQPHKRLLRLAYEEVKREIPVESLWIPESGGQQ